MRFMRAGAAVLATGALLLLGGCGDDDERNDETGASAGDTTPTATQPEVTASAEFVTPEAGSEVDGTVTAKVKLTDFKLDGEAVGKSPQPGFGHLHFSMDEGKYDNAKYSGPNGELAEKLGVDGKYSPSIEPEITYENLPPGKHVLEVYLANNNHTDTGIEASTEFTVK